MKTINLATITTLLLLTISCSSGSDNGELMEPDQQNDIPSDPGGDSPDPGSISYAADIAPIISANCVSCHDDPPTQNAPMPLLTMAQVEEAVTNRNLLGLINSTSNPMPPGGRLPSSTRQLIQDWVDLGFPE